MKIITVKDWIFTEYFLSNWNGISLEIVETDALTVWGQHVVLHFHSEFTKQLACHSISVELMKHFTKHLKQHWFGEFSNVIYWPKKKEQKAINVFAAEYQFSFLQRQRHHTSANCHDKSQTTSFFCIFAQLAAVTERQKQGLLQYQKWSRRWKVLCLISPHLTF